ILEPVRISTPSWTNKKQENTKRLLFNRLRTLARSLPRAKSNRLVFYGLRTLSPKCRGVPRRAHCSATRNQQLTEEKLSRGCRRLQRRHLPHCERPVLP